ncbi:MAG: LysE family translocator [Bdellovibrionales bacterium]
MDLAVVNEMPVWLRGIMLGLALSAPVGPIGLLCIRRTIDRGPFTGFTTGLGAAVADTVYAALAAFGVSAIIHWLAEYDQQLRVIGGAIMCGMAWSIYQARPTAPAKAKSAKNLFTAFTSGFALTFTNPVTILAIIALVATLAGGEGTLKSMLLVGGVFVGAAGWWLTLVGIATLIREHFTIRTIIYLNRFTGMLLAMFGFGVMGYALGQTLTAPWPQSLFS